MRLMFFFAFATLLPVPLIASAALSGGWWVLAAFLYMTAFVFMLDELVTIVTTPTKDDREFPVADQLSTLLAVLHFFLLFLVVWALSSNTALGFFESIGLFLAAGMFFGQVSNSNAHELIHRSKRLLFNLGKWVYISLLFGHHTSAHPLVHHRFVATQDDPNSAEKGESFYEFAPRAWIGSARAGYEMETARRNSLPEKRSALSHPYVTYVLGALGSLGLAWLVGGFKGVLALLLLAGYAQMQLLLSDYVQHYGLRRAQLAGGRFEPVDPRHSWNAPHWYSNFLMLAAPRHSDHHAHPAKPYPALELPTADEAPILPYSLPVMAGMALYPPLWRRVMDKRLTRWETPARPVI